MGILVVADDLTGAAEIGGIVLRYGCSVEIVQRLAHPSKTDVQVLNTNTRSLSWDKAQAHLQDLFSKAPSASWDWIYLKFDSALRGHIKDEIPFYRSVFGKDSVLFCPVNPMAGRIICEGTYWIEGIPIAETDFARDPEFPIRESKVLDALSAPSWYLTGDVGVCLDGHHPYVVAAVSDMEGLAQWAAPIYLFGLYAGAAAFFEALLSQRLSGALGTVEKSGIALQRPLCYVCGSKYEKSVTRIRSIDSDKVVYWYAIGNEEELAREICAKMARYGEVMFAVDPTIVGKNARTVRENMAEVLALAREHCQSGELLIEGGATAHAILAKLGVEALSPDAEFGPGVIRNRVPGVAWKLTLKPGSYSWPEALWRF